MNTVFIAVIAGLLLGLAFCLWWYERLCRKHKKEIENWTQATYRARDEIERVCTQLSDLRHKGNEEANRLLGELKTLDKRLKKKLLKALPEIIFEISRTLFSDMYANQRAEKLAAAILEKMKKELGE